MSNLSLVPSTPSTLSTRLDQFLDKLDAGKPEAVDDGRTLLQLNTKQHEMNDVAEVALAEHPDVYQRGGSLVRVLEGAKKLILNGLKRPPDAPVISVIPPAAIGELLTARIRFEKDSKQEGGWVPTHPPTWMIQTIAARGSYKNIRPLTGVIESPVLRPDGSLITEPGYDQTSGLLYVSGGIVPVLPDRPTRDDAVRAVALFKDLVCDFPFETGADFAVWLAAVLTPLCRHAFTGSVPLFVFDSSTAGSGKTLLAELVSRICFGRTLARMAPSRDDEEMRKRITTIVMAGDPLVLIDNVIGDLGGAALDAAITGEVWADRLLGMNQGVRLPLTAVWIATGNNVSFRGDTARRVLQCRIVSPYERPEERTGFKCPKLLEHVASERKSFLESALIILIAYCAAGRPRQVRALGSFESWSDLVRSCIVWAGCADPADTRVRSRESDHVASTLPELFKGIQELDPKTIGVGTSGMLTALNSPSFPPRHEQLRQAIESLCPGRGSPIPDAEKLGSFLGRHKDKPIGGLILRRRTANGKPLWFVEKAPSVPNAEPVVSVSIAELSNTGSPTPSAAKPGVNSIFDQIRRDTARELHEKGR